MNPFDKELLIRLKGIEDQKLRNSTENLFSGRLEFENKINELRERDEFKKFLSSWKYKSKVIYNTKLWKNHESDFFNLSNSYFILNTEDELNIFQTFLEKECQKNIQQQKIAFSEDEITDIYNKYLMNSNSIDIKEKLINALKDVLKNNISASYENILFLTKKIKVNISKIEWYSKLGLSDDQVSVIYNKNLFYKDFPDYRDTIANLAINKFKLIAHKSISKDVRKQLIKELHEKPRMTKKDIENKIDSSRIFNEDDINITLNTLKSSWPKLDIKTKKDISFQLYKIKERIKQ